MSEDYGLKISRPGVDVGTATVLDLIFSSKYDYLRIFSNGSGSVTVPAANVGVENGSVSVSISHNLGYYPAFIVFSDSPLWNTAGRFSTYTTRGVGILTPIHPNYSCGTDNLNLKFFNANGTSIIVQYKYHIYLNKIT